MSPVILVDIDGTIALRGDRSPHDHDSAMEDAVNWPIVTLCNDLQSTHKYRFILLSGRQEKYRDITEYWLDTHSLLPYRIALYMRATGDQRPDEVVKLELYNTLIKPRYPVWYVLDDRDKVVQMWRDNNLVCLQVAKGDF